MSKGGNPPTMPISGHGTHGSHHNSATDSYTSAAIPSRNNPFSFLNRRSRSKPLGQIIDETEEQSAAYQQGFLSGFNSAGYFKGMDAANKIHKYDTLKICQVPYKPYADTNSVCGREINDWMVSIGIIYGSIFLLFCLMICRRVFLQRRKQKHSKKAQASSKIAEERSAEKVEAVHLDFIQEQ
ncbi:MAG: hypothetical protein Q9224_006872 [Gallowayella concinna]